MGSIQSCVNQKKEQNSQIKTEISSCERVKMDNFISQHEHSGNKEQNNNQSQCSMDVNSQSIMKNDSQENSFKFQESLVENEFDQEKKTEKNDENYSFLNNEKKNDKIVQIDGTQEIGKSPVIEKNKIDVIQNTQISFKEDDYPWLKQRLEQFGMYEPPEKFVDDQSHFVSNNILPDKSKYEGFMKNDKRHGYGINLQQTELFEGSFQNGLRQGWGRRLTQDILESGYWENGNIQQNMEMQTKDIYYKGECKNSIPNGKGFLKRSISTYTGDFVKGRMEGKGIFEDLIKKTKYEGEFLCDKYHGYGTYYFSSGKKYVGQFKNSQFDGQGEMFWPDNCYYKGQFVNGLFEGQGYYIDQQQSIHEGYWKNGKKNGKGKYTQKNLVIQGIWENDIFQEDN